MLIELPIAIYQSLYPDAEWPPGAKLPETVIAEWSYALEELMVLSHDIRVILEYQAIRRFQLMTSEQLPF